MTNSNPLKERNMMKNAISQWPVVLLLLASTVPQNGALAHEGVHDEFHVAAANLTEKAQTLVKAHKPNPGIVANRLLFEFDDPSRQTLDFVPLMGRNESAVRMGLMRTKARQATHALLRAILSEEGYLRVDGIRSLEDVLRHSTESGLSMGRLTDAYALQIYGAPSLDTPWGMKFEGHHVSVNATVVGTHMRGTPLFLGSNPAEIRTGPRAGFRVLGPQQDLAWDLLKSLTEDQKRQALSKADLKKTIQRGPLPALRPTSGLAGEKMSKAQQALMLALVRSYATTLHPTVAHEELQRIETAGLDRLHFLWHGSTTPGSNHYYCIQGPTVLLEFDVLESSANHIHSLWRDPERDFGRDLLLEHYHAEHTTH